MDWLTKKRVTKIIDENYTDKEFTTSEVMSMLPHDRHLPNSNELSKFLSGMAIKRRYLTTHKGKHVIWEVEQ